MSRACHKVPFWLDRPYWPRPALTGDTTCEVCVIGGGAGGVAAAWRLAQRGVEVCLLEADEIASGASGRNGGFFLAGVAPMYDRARKLWGRERAMRLYALTRSAQDEMLATSKTIRRTRGLFRLTGLLRLAVDAGEADAVRSHHAALREDGFPGELVAEADLPPALRRPGRIGLLTPHDGGMHPARWVRALSTLAERHGARLYEGTPVTAPPRADGAGVAVITAAGTVRADRVVIACDGGLAALLPAAAHVRARRLNMLATAPAPEVLPAPVYARDGHEYAQQLPGGRITLGGFSDLDGDESWTDRADPSDRVQARLDTFLREELGVDVRVTHRWAGVVGYATDPVPTVGAADPSGRIIGMGGYNGTGVVQSWVAARITAELICDGASADAALYAPASSSAAHSPE